MLDNYQNSHKTIPLQFFFWNKLIANALLINSVTSYFIGEEHTVFLNLKLDCWMHTINSESSHSSYFLALQLHCSFRNANETTASARSSIRFNTPLSSICTVAYEVEFRPRQLAHILQYTDFFTCNSCWAILTDGKQLHYLLTDAND